MWRRNETLLQSVKGPFMENSGEDFIGRNSLWDIVHWRFFAHNVRWRPPFAGISSRKGDSISRRARAWFLVNTLGHLEWDRGRQNSHQMLENTVSKASFSGHQQRFQDRFERMQKCIQLREVKALSRIKISRKTFGEAYIQCKYILSERMLLVRLKTTCSTFHYLWYHTQKRILIRSSSLTAMQLFFRVLFRFSHIHAVGNRRKI